MLTRLLLAASLLVMVLAVACAGGEATAAKTPNPPASIELSALESSAPNATPVNEADAAAALASFAAGEALHREGRLDQAIVEYGDAIRLNPQLAMAYAGRGYAYAETEQYQKAIHDYDQTIRLDPNNAAAHYGRGFANFELDQFETAMQDFDKAIRLCLDPQLAQTNAGRALAYRILGRYEERLPEC